MKTQTPETPLWAIVVTNNRLELLKKCIRACREQKFVPDHILVVNNASTDGTTEWLAQQMDLHVITQRNLGSAGGFHYGLKYAYRKGGEYFWLLDDDGLPHTECLSRLYETIGRDFHYVAPNLFDYDGNSHNPKLQEFKREVLDHCGGPFNGILISRHLVEEIGVPITKLFLKGDEYEYVDRVREAAFHVALVKSAKHYHKQTKVDYRQNKLGYYFARNNIYRARLFTGRLYSRKLFSLYMVYATFIALFRFLRHGNLGQTVAVCRGILDAVRCNRKELENLMHEAKVSK